MRIDLEGLAAGYEHRPTSPAGLERARRAAAAARLGSGQAAIDVGGGPGGHAAVWAGLGATAVVVDPSAAMAARAMSNPGVTAIRAVSQALPLRSGAITLVYFHLSIHYGDWKRALDEALRVLHPGGECWIWTMGEKHHRASFLTRWFPSVGDIDAARFPAPEALSDYLRDAGAAVETGREVEHREMTAAAWREAAAAGFVSTLQLISDDEFRSGLIAFDQTYPEPGEIVDYVLTFDWLRARR